MSPQSSPKVQAAPAPRVSAPAPIVHAAAPPPPALRADAQRNFDRLLAAAHREFAARGAEVPLEDIARRAGVGIGTLYRHFPTREDLLARVLTDATERLLATGRAALARPPVTTAADDLLGWIRDLADYTATYRGLTGALAASTAASPSNATRLCSSCGAMQELGGALLARAQAAGEIRPDAQVREVLLSAHSAAWIAEHTADPSAVRRLLAILFDGLRVITPLTPAACTPSGTRRRSRPGTRRGIRRSRPSRSSR